MVLFHHIDCPVSWGPTTVLEGKNLLTVMRHLKTHNGEKPNKCKCSWRPPMQAISGHIGKHAEEVSHTNAISVINDYASSRADRHRQPQQRKVIQMQPVWLCVISSEPFEGAFDDTYKGRTIV